MEKLTDDQMADLTDEEKAALEEDDGSGGQSAAEDAAAAEADADDPPAGDDDAAEGDADPAAGADAPAAGADEGAPPAAATPAPAKAAEPAAVPLLDATMPADADAKLQAIADRKAALATQLDDGEITTREYQTSLDGLNDERAAISEARFKANLAAEIQTNQAKAAEAREKDAWNTEVNTFLAEKAEYLEDPTRFHALDNEVKRLARLESSRKLTARGVLDLAHDNLAKAFGAREKGAVDPPAAKPQPGRKPAVPPTLGRLPAADAEQLGGGEFAALDRLQRSDPLAYEERLFKLPPDQRDRYLAQ